MKFSITLFGLVQALKFTARTQPEFAERLKQKNFTAQFRLQDNSQGRWIQFDNGKIRSRKGIHESPDLSIHFKSQAIAEEFLSLPVNHLVQIDAMKTSKSEPKARMSWRCG